MGTMMNEAGGISKMVKIPDSWSDREPKNISPKRQALCFHKAFHQELTERGFFCVSDRLPEEKRPSAQTLVDLCRYYRPVGRDLLQIVDGSLTQVSDALDNNGVFSRYLGTGGHIGVNVFSLFERFAARFPPFGYGYGVSQQRIVRFQFPGMEKDWCNSFLNLFRDDFSYAMELEKQLFFEETLPWLDQMTTPEKHAQWRMETFSKYFRKDRGAKNALWSQLKLRRWEVANTCIQAYFDSLEELGLKGKFISPELKEEMAFYESIRQAIAREDTAYIDQILEENKKKNLAVLASVSKGINWKQIIYP